MDLYKILCVEVLDTENKLKEISNTFKIFAHEESVQLEFNPHLTLAYVQPDFELSTNYSIPDFIKIKEVKYSGEP